MTDDLSALDNLRPEVREAVREIAVAAAVARPDLQRSIATIRDELLRLTKENADYARGRKADQDMAVSQLERAEKAEAENADFRNARLRTYRRYRACEAELAALKARVADAPVASVRVDDRMHVSIGARSNAVDFVPLHTKRVALVKVEE